MTAAFKKKLNMQNIVSRQDNLLLAERLDTEIADMEQKLRMAENVKDDGLQQALGVKQVG